MDKLYSRGLRFLLPHNTNVVNNSNNNNNNKNNNQNLSSNNHRLTKKNKIIITVIAIICIIFIFIFNGIRIIEPVYYEVAINETKKLTVKISNEVAKDVMNKYNYTDLMTIHKDDNNNVTMIETNIININRIRAEIASQMQDKINNIDYESINLAMGSFTGIKMFIGKGPKIPIKITTIGDIDTEYVSQFKSAGINQTSHQICLVIKCNIGIMSSFKTINKELETTVVLAENIIIGNVPESYYNFKGIDENESLNMIQ